MPRPRKRARLTSIDVLGIGLGWDWVSSDAEIVRRLLVFLEDRRALAYEHFREDMGHVVESVLRIREELVKVLQELAPDSGAARSVRVMRDACLVFLDQTQGAPEWGLDPRFISALSELRTIFALYCRALADRYEVTVHGPLAEVLRALDQADDAAEGGAA